MASSWWSAPPYAALDASTLPLLVVGSDGGERAVRQAAPGPARRVLYPRRPRRVPRGGRLAARAGHLLRRLLSGARRAATAGGAMAYLCPSAYFVGGEHRRDLYYAARALDNGIYVVMAGLTGRCGDEQFSGGTAVYDPEGRPVSGSSRERRHRRRRPRPGRGHPGPRATADARLPGHRPRRPDRHRSSLIRRSRPVAAKGSVRRSAPGRVEERRELGDVTRCARTGHRGRHGRGGHRPGPR